MKTKDALKLLFGANEGVVIGKPLSVACGVDVYTVIVDRFRSPQPKPKRYVLPMEGTNSLATMLFAALDKENDDGSWTTYDCNSKETAVRKGYTVTQADIDVAPDWVNAITPVEVTNDGIC